MRGSDHENDVLNYGYESLFFMYMRMTANIDFSLLYKKGDYIQNQVSFPYSKKVNPGNTNLSLGTSQQLPAGASIE